jgi:hypothetical protein
MTTPATFAATDPADALPAVGPSITVEGKTFGKKGKLFEPRQIAFPAEWESGGVTLRDLIAHVVRGEVAAYRERQEARSVVRALTSRQIEEGAAAGKIDMGGQRDADPASITDEAAVETALTAFGDGLYYVFLDDNQVTELEAPMAALRDGARVTFLRLVALAGG